MSGGFLLRTPRCWVSMSPSPDEWHHWRGPFQGLKYKQPLPLCTPRINRSSAHFHTAAPAPLLISSGDLIKKQNKTSLPFPSLGTQTFKLTSQKALLLLATPAFARANIIKSNLRTPPMQQVNAAPYYFPSSITHSIFTFIHYTNNMGIQQHHHYVTQSAIRTICRGLKEGGGGGKTLFFQYFSSYSPDKGRRPESPGRSYIYKNNSKWCGLKLPESPHFHGNLEAFDLINWTCSHVICGRGCCWWVQGFDLSAGKV